MIIVEYMQNGIEHANCNASIIGACINNAPNEIIHFFAGEEHFEEVSAFLQKSGINISNIKFHPITPIGKPIKDYQYWRYQFETIKNIINFSKKKRRL